MRLKLLPLVLLSFALISLLIPFKSVFAAGNQLSGTIKDSTGTAVAGATIDVYTTGTTTDIVPPVTSANDGTGSYTVTEIPSGTYDIKVTAPSGSTFNSILAVGQSISSNTVLNFIFAPNGKVTLSGTLYDSTNTPVPNATIKLVVPNSSTQVATTTTNASGFYSLTANSGNYGIDITGSSNTPNLPSQYEVGTGIYSAGTAYSLTQSKITNIKIPVKQVTVYLQDSSGNSLPNFKVRTNYPSLTSGVVFSPDITNGSASTGYTVTSTFPVSDNSGNVTFWLVPMTYNVTAIPPSGSQFLQTIASINITNSVSNYTMTVSQAVVLSGILYDSTNTPVPNATVKLVVPNSSSQVATSTTNASGFYSLTAAAGNYGIDISGSSNTANLPPQYELGTGLYSTATAFSLSQSMTENITLPLKQITVHIQDSFGNAIVNAQVKTNYPSLTTGVTLNNDITNGSASTGYTKNFPLTDSSGNVKLWLVPMSYTITVVPPSGSGFIQSATTTTFTNSTTNFPITLQKPPVTLSGIIYDSNNTPVPNATVALNLPNTSTNITSTTTNASGFYSVTAAPAPYSIVIKGSNNTLRLPSQFEIGNAIYSADSPYNLTQTSTENITLPLKQINVHIQDQTGAAVSNVQLKSNYPVTTSQLTLSNDISNGTGSSGYTSNYPVTDSSGNATLWLLPSNYNITATPQTGGTIYQINLSNLTVSNDSVQTDIIALQYNHAAPTTTSTLTTQRSDGTFTNPTTVSLSASAASGYTVATTYYTIDGGAQQTYSAPFNVTGDGNHTIAYWSVDNSGVPETHNTKDFTIITSHSLIGTVYIDANQNGFQDTGENGYAGAVVTVNTGQTATTDVNGNYSLANLPADTYVETLTLPSGYTATTTNPATIALSADTTQNFGIAPANSLVTAINAGGTTSDSYVSDTGFSGGSTYTASTTVDTSSVTNPAPQDVYQTVRYGNFSYTVPNLTPNSAYTLRLHFNELYWTSAGHRVFNVSVNGTQALSNYDIYQAAGGANKAVVEQIPTIADSNGNVTVQFTTVSDNALVNGIEVYTGTVSSSPTPTPTPVVSEAINAAGSSAGNYLADNGYT
ncbi:MAG: carboxypeptidase regulatory-like domain-containing protein, partial [Candidatus Levyibacteriota bacterium]